MTRAFAILAAFVFGAAMSACADSAAVEDRAFTVHAWAALAPNAQPNDGYTLMWKGSRNVTPNVGEYRLTVYFGSPSFTYFDEKGQWQGIMVGVTDRAYIAGKGFKKPLSEMPKFSPGAWRLVTAVYDRGRVALYLDDKLLAETKGNPPPPRNSCPPKVGISESPEGRPCWKMSGKIAFEKYEERALSSAGMPDTSTLLSSRVLRRKSP